MMICGKGRGFARPGAALGGLKTSPISGISFFKPNAPFYDCSHPSAAKLIVFVVWSEALRHGNLCRAPARFVRPAPVRGGFWIARELIWWRIRRSLSRDSIFLHIFVSNWSALAPSARAWSTEIEEPIAL